MVCCANKLNKLSSQVCRLNYHTNLYLSTRWQAVYSIHALLTLVQNGDSMLHYIVGVPSHQTETVELLKHSGADMVPVPTDVPDVTVYMLCDVRYLGQFKSGVLGMPSVDLHGGLFDVKQLVDDGVMGAKYGGDIEVLGVLSLPTELLPPMEPSEEIEGNIVRENGDELTESENNEEGDGRTLADVEARLKEILDVTETETTVV